MTDVLDAYLDDLDADAAGRRSGAPEDVRRYLTGLAEPYVARHEPVAELVEQTACAGYRRDRIELEVLPGIRFRAYLLIPDPVLAPSPAVVALHGHGYGSRQIVGLQPDGSPAPEDPAGQYAVSMARRGLITIAPDVAGFGDRMTAGDRRFDPDAGYSCYRLVHRLALHGLTLAGMRIAETRGVISYLASREEVDPHRIGLIGHSGGATLALLTSVVDDRAAALALSAYPNTFAASIETVHHCACNYLPGILGVAELPDLLAAVAPRPLFCESGEHDPIFPVHGFREAMRRAAEAYDRAGAADRLTQDLFPGVHQVSGRRMFDWLNDTLQSMPA
jgi:dienelactone hydrolase